MKIGIIDYGVGNLKSVTNALIPLDVNCVVSSNPAELSLCEGLILPGDGAAKAGMDNLNNLGLIKFIKNQINMKKPFLGICLGMQLLLDFSEEGNINCLGLLEGKVQKLKTQYKIPQIGWNQVAINKNSKLMKNIKNNSFFYFINSYICVSTNKKIISGTTNYGNIFCSALEKDTIFGVQFHPEKSGEVGKQVFKNFMEVIYENNSCN